MLNRFVSYFTLELGYFVQDLDAQQAERAIARDGTKFLEFREMLELAKFLKELGIGTQIRFMLKEFHDDDAPGAKRHKGENPENNHGYNIGLRDHLQYRYSIVQDNLQKNFTKIYVLYYNTKKHNPK